MVLNGKLWSGMFRDKRQTFGGSQWADEQQEWGTQQNLEREPGPDSKGSCMASSEVHSSLKLQAPPLPCDRRSLLSLGPSNRSWLGRLSEWFRQGSSRLSVWNEVPGARGRVMGRGLVAEQGLQRQGKWCWEESHQVRGKWLLSIPNPSPSVTEVRLLTLGSGIPGCQTPRPSHVEHQLPPGYTPRGLLPTWTRGGTQVNSRSSGLTPPLMRTKTSFSSPLLPEKCGPRETRSRPLMYMHLLPPVSLV